MKRKRSFALISAIIIMVLVSIAVLGLSFFIIESSRKLVTRRSLLKSFYLAEAGIQEAIYSYRQRGRFSLGEKNVGIGQSYRLEADEADLLMVNTRETVITRQERRGRGRGRRRSRYYLLDGITLKNATDSEEKRTLEVNRMKVSWPNPGVRLTQITIFWFLRVWRGNVQSGEMIDLDRDIRVRWWPLLPLNLRFENGNPAEKNNGEEGEIFIQFIMQDESESKKWRVYPQSDQFNFTVASKGLIQQELLQMSASIEAEYNAANATIVTYKKIQ